MTPFLILLAFVLGVGVGAISKIHININHTHKHVMDKPVEKPVDKQEQEYNASYGDPEKMLYLNQQFGGEDDR